MLLSSRQIGRYGRCSRWSALLLLIPVVMFYLLLDWHALIDRAVTS